jgi:hypothetical protein
MTSLRSRMRRDDGMNTAEYAVGTIAAVAFAALLLRVLTSESVQNALTAIIQRALQLVAPGGGGSRGPPPRRGASAGARPWNSRCRCRP